MESKHILRYLRGTSDIGLFYSKAMEPQLLGYADAGYLSDPHKARSQTGDIYLLMEILQYPGDQLNKRWWPPPLIIQTYLRCMKLIKNVLG